MDRIETETETHRLEKALKAVAPTARLPFPRGSVRLVTEPAIAASPVGQHLSVLLCHLLARMKGIVTHIGVPSHFADTPIHDGVPLVGSDLLDGLGRLVTQLSGPESRHSVRLDVVTISADISAAIGTAAGADIRLGADSWRALTGRFAHESRWDATAPFGPYMAAAIGASVILRMLLHVNWNERWDALPDLAFSLYDYTTGSKATRGPDVADLTLSDLTLAGAGAGGTAALYTLASLPKLTGELAIVEPEYHKLSNLGRYLMVTYDDVRTQTHKLDTAHSFLARHAPALDVQRVAQPWEVAPRPAGVVIATVDTLGGRWAIQQDVEGVILEAGVDGLLYTVLRVADDGRCLDCKTPRDPNHGLIRRAKIWGISVQEAEGRHKANPPITEADLERLAVVQNSPRSRFAELEGTLWNDAPALVECGDTRLSAVVPAQIGTLPMATTAAGVVIAAEVTKHLTGMGLPLDNSLEHVLDRAPSARSQRKRPPRPGCPNHRGVPTQQGGTLPP